MKDTKDSYTDYRALFERNPLPMWIVDAKSTRFLDVNDAAILHYGYSREEFLSLTLFDIRPPEDVPMLQEQLAKIPMDSGLRLGGTWRHSKKDGTIITVEVTHSRVLYNGCDAFFAVMNDITQRKKYEETLTHSTKMEAVGRLAGGVAHDFNNILTIILGYCNLTLDQLKPWDPLRQNIEGVRKAAERAALLTRQMLAFSRRQVLQPKVLDLNAIVEDTSKMLRRLISEDIDLETALDPSLDRIKADPGQIEQILINLTVNARDAMPDGGRIVIETRNAQLDSDYALSHVETKPGRYVLIAVSDDGIGMDKDTQS